MGKRVSGVPTVGHPGERLGHLARRLGLTGRGSTVVVLLGELDGIVAVISLVEGFRLDVECL